MIKFLGMPKWVFLTASIFYFSLPASSVELHMLGGEMGYEFVRKDFSSVTYKIILKIYRVCNDPVDFEPTVTVKVLNTTDIRQSTHQVEFFKLLFINKRRTQLPHAARSYCVVNDPADCVEMLTFTEEVTLADSPEGYTIYWDMCCRNGRTNIDRNDNSCTSSEMRFSEIFIGEGTTYSCKIPRPSLAAKNTSPVITDSVIAGCIGRPLQYQFKFQDAEGDSLAYNLANSYCLTNTATTEFFSVFYNQGFSGSRPMGGNPVIGIDPRNGLLSGVPDKTGRFAVVVEVSEYRASKLINIHRKEVQINVYDCEIQPPQAQVNCQDRTIVFLHNNKSNNNLFHWDFGVPGIDTDVSSDSLPTYVYAANGDYNVRLTLTNPAGCSETTSSTIKVYAGLQPDFTWNGPVCNGQEILLRDASVFPVGTITNWQWQLINTQKIISTQQHTKFEYAVSNNSTYPFTIRLTVRTDKGCTGSIQKVVEVFPQPIAYAGPDTIIAFNRSYQLLALTKPDYHYLWSPATGLSDPTIPNPILNSNQDQVYILRVSSANTCVGYDTVSIKYFKGPEIYVPNAFSPNGDGKNDIFRIKPVSMHVQSFAIYNRWGHVIYTSPDYRKGWDGRVNGRLQDAGLYVWVLIGKDEDGKPVTRSGNIMLVR